MVESQFKGGKSALEMLTLLKHENISRTTIYRAVKRIQYAISLSRKEGSGGKSERSEKIRAKRKFADHLRRNPAEPIRKLQER